MSDAELGHDFDIKQAKRELRYTKKRLRRLLEIGRIGLFELDLATNDLSCSGDFESLYGLEQGAFDCTWDGWAALIHPEDYPEVQRQLKVALATGAFRAEWRVVLPREEVRWIEGRGAVYKGLGRRPSCMVGVHVDITRQKNLEQDLNLSNMFLERIMQSVSCALLVLDREEKIIKLNAAAFGLTGYDCSQLLYQPLSVLFEPQTYLVIRENFDSLSVQNDIAIFDLPLIRKDGVRRMVTLHAASMREDGIANGIVAVLRDVTEEREVQEQLQERELRYRTIFDAANDGLFIHCAETGAIVDVNAKAQQMYGYTREEMCRLSVGELSGSEFSQRQAQEVMRRVSNGEPQLFEWLGKDRRGRQFWVEVNLKRVTLEGKQRLLAVVRDISERKLATEALQESEEKFHTLADNIAQFAWMADAEGKVFWYNKRWLDYTGMTMEQLAGEGWKSVHHPDHLQRVEEKLRECIRNGTDWEDIMPLRCRCGEYRWFLSRAKPIRESHGKGVRWFGTHTDITEQRKTEEMLRATEEQLSLAQAAAGIGIWSWDLRSNVATMTDQYLAVLDIQRPPETFEEFLDMMHRDDREKVQNDLQTALAGAGKFESRFRVYWGDGAEHWILGRGRIYNGPDGSPQRIAGVIFDISDRVAAEENLNRTMEELYRSNRELEQFAYVASHDLQEPLRMVTSYLRLLEKKYKGALDEKADQYIHFAINGAERMQQLIEGLLTYSRITRSGTGIRIVDTNAIVETAVANLHSRITETNATVTSERLPNMRGDPILLLQLFQNLISNGLKYRRPGVPPRIDILCNRIGQEWVFSVQDNGVGIAPHDFDRIFQLFQRLHSMTEVEGTGIGLASCKKIVERHGGRIWLESVPGEGSTFHFTIPL